MECMPSEQDYLGLDDRTLLRQCDVHAYRASGPGGQRRNKVATAVRLVHRPTGVSAHADESRYQPENKRRAIARVRMNIACRLRRSLKMDPLEIPPVVAECIIAPRKGTADAARRLAVGRKDRRFWPVAAFLLDLLAACRGKVSRAGACLDITTANFVAVLKTDKRLLAAAQAIRKENELKPLR
jgi:hypothetical protein